MSEISDAAKAVVFMSDFASADAAGKFNIIGAGWTITGIQPTGMTAPNAVVVFIDIPSRFYGESCPVSLSLLDDTGTPVELPGQPGAIRVAQLAKIERPSVQGAHLPPDVPSRIQMIMNFPNGLPLQPGRMYKWQLEIDSDSRPEWEASFFIIGPPPAPVMG